MLTGHDHLCYVIFVIALSISNAFLVMKPFGATLGKLEGEIDFNQGIIFKVLEMLDFAKGKLALISH